MAAFETFLKVDGVAGESVDVKHRGEIVVETWSWHETAPPAAPTGGGTGAGRVSMADLAFTTRVSKASPPLLLACATGRRLRTAVLIVRRAGGARLDFLTISLAEVTVTGFDTVTGPDDGVVDSVSLGFVQIRYAYREQKADGSLGAATEVGWDRKLNTRL